TCDCRSPWQFLRRADRIMGRRHSPRTLHLTPEDLARPDSPRFPRSIGEFPDDAREPRFGLSSGHLYSSKQTELFRSAHAGKSERAPVLPPKPLARPSRTRPRTLIMDSAAHRLCSRSVRPPSGPRWPSDELRPRPQPTDPIQDGRKQPARDRRLRELERYRPRVMHHLRADLDQLLAQGRQGPRPHRPRVPGKPHLPRVPATLI